MVLPVNGRDDGWHNEMPAWLESTPCTAARLADWLQGYDIPPVGHDDEPYLWLLRALPAGEKQRPSAARVAAALADLLLQISSKSMPNIDRPSQLLYNALMLAAGLNEPEMLSAPIHTIATYGAVSGEWLGIELTDALRTSLIYNQTGTDFVQEWLSILHEGEGRIFSGTHYDAFEGIVLMPVSDGESQSIWMDALGEALFEISGLLEEDESSARDKFQNLLNRAAEARLYPPFLDRDLVLAAHRWNWSQWAVECLPNLYIRLNTATEQQQDILALIWSRLAFLLPPTDPFTVTRNLCGGAILEVKLSPQAADRAGIIASEVEPLRKQNPYFSTSSVLGTINDAVVVLQDTAEARGDHAFARSLRQKQVEMSRELRIAV